MTRDQLELEMEMFRRQARKSMRAFVPYMRSDFHLSNFSRLVSDALDDFVRDVEAGKRPVLVFNAPPQHGKSELVSRLLPAFLLGYLPPRSVVATASYAASLARSMAAAVQRNMMSDEYAAVRPEATLKGFKGRKTSDFFETPNESEYIAVGRGGGLTGRKVTVAILDDIIKNAQEAVSQVVKDATWNWFESVVMTRMAEKSGIIVMATNWSEDDFAVKVIEKFKDTGRLRWLRFPALNFPDETGYNPDLPEGALVPELHSVEQMREVKAALSPYYWNAMFQSNPVARDGNLFGRDGVQYYTSLPNITQWCLSVDATFKDTEQSDYVVIQCWGKSGKHDFYLIDQIRGQMSFTKTCEAIELMIDKYPQAHKKLIEDKANGAAIIDLLSKKYQGITPVTPLGGKESRAQAVEGLWTGKRVYLPDPKVMPWVESFVSEVLAFPVGKNDDQVDGMTQALNDMFKRTSIGSLLTREMVARVSG